VVPEQSLGNPSVPRGADQSIARAHAQRTAFVGRTLRGPVNIATIVRSFTDFQQTFGGLWQPSPLSYAVEQFFEQGGRQAVIVRVANGALPITLTLQCGRESLKLEARAPGTREFLRASVDYDHIPADDESRFNLVVQRVRSPGSERIEEQEIFRGLSIEPSAPRFVTTAVLESKMVRVRGLVPLIRPEPTFLPGTNLPVGYVSSNPDGNDGRPLTDYDVIGSVTRRSGLFALEGVDDLAFVYIPPLSRNQDIGASALLVAGKFCREQRIMLIVDPPVEWATPTDAIAGSKALDFHSDSAVMFFPRIVCMDRLRGRAETFGNGGAVAGILSRSGEVLAAIVNPPEPDPILRAGAKLTREVNTVERSRLATNGINVLQTVRSADRNRPLLRTLSGGASGSSDWAYLAPRRFALFIVGAIERGTRWAVIEPRNEGTWVRLRQQVSSFLRELRIAGAFASVTADQAFTVICDDRINDGATSQGTAADSLVNILVQFAAIHVGEYHSFMISHGTHASTVRPIAVNRLESALLVSAELEQEITLSIFQDGSVERIGALAN
jgi:hypothetical protein